MAFQLADLVVAGFLYHSRPHCTHGRLLLRGCEMPILVELTGDPCEDLRGLFFEFDIPENDRPANAEDRRLVARFHKQQIGAVGEMTALHRPEPPASAGESDPAPTLFLEWFSQNGQVILELPVSAMRVLDPNNLPEDDGEESDESDSADEDSADGDPESSADTDWEPDSDDDSDFLDDLPEAPRDDDEDYGLIPQELDRALEASAHRLDHEITGGSEEESKEMRETRMMDELIEHGQGTPVANFLEKLHLPKPSAIQSEAEAAQALKAALIELALFGVALDICEHCNATESYRILIDKICPESTIFAQMRGTGWVQHFSTSDDCKLCRPELG